MKKIRRYFLPASIFLGLGFMSSAFAATSINNACQWLANKTLRGKYLAYRYGSWETYKAGPLIIHFGSPYIDPIIHSYTYKVQVVMPFFKWPAGSVAQCIPINDSKYYYLFIRGSVKSIRPLLRMINLGPAGPASHFFSDFTNFHDRTFYGSVFDGHHWFNVESSI